MKASVTQRRGGGNMAPLLLAWYDAHRRILPWRALASATPNPYHVWLSEMMLQQTTVTAVIPYFHKFLRKWPTLQLLSRAKRDEIFSAWAGLGYYRRARFLHEAAVMLCREHGGKFPSDETSLRKIPGCGPYTAAAIASIAFDQPTNVVDGNVERVMARIFAVSSPIPKARAILKTKAASLLPDKRFGDYAQALMDLGSMVCTPRAPRCEACPWKNFCAAHAKGKPELWPRRAPKKAKPVRCAVAFVVLKDDQILLRQRPPTGLLASMMEVPSSAWREDPMPSLKDVWGEAPCSERWTLLPDLVRHTFSHFELELRVARLTITSQKKIAEGRFVKVSELAHAALPSVMRKIIRVGVGG